MKKLRIKFMKFWKIRSDEITFNFVKGKVFPIKWEVNMS